MLEEQCEDSVRTPDPGNMTTEGNRHTPDALRQSPAQAYILNALRDLQERVAMLENENKEKREWFNFFNTQLQLLQSVNRPIPGRVTRIGQQDKEENEKLKEKIKKLEERNEELLSKTMAMHKNSEDMNDPSNLSAVLQMYEKLQLREWVKVKSSTPSWTYERGSQIIRKLFDACEEDIEQRTDAIFKVLDIPPLNDPMTNSKQRIIREIKNLFGHPDYQNHSKVYSEIVKDPPVKAEWNIEGKWAQNLEHVDKKSVMYWKKPVLLLWPIMKREETPIVKGVRR